MNDTTVFLAKVLALSALLSLLIKYGGPLLPLRSPFTASLNGLVTLIILLPSVTIGIGLIALLNRPR